MSKLTRKAIIDSFMSLLKKKSLDKITVKDIIESADINRNTFYYHFQDIYDLLENIFVEESERFRRETNPESSFYDEYLRTADFFHEHKEAIIHIYYSKSRYVLNRYLESATNYFVRRFVEQNAENTNIDIEGIDYITCFYSYTIIGATMKWVENNMPNYREKLIRNISDSFEATVKEMIVAYINGSKDD